MFIRYEAQLEKDWKYVIEDSDSKVLVVATDAIYQKVKDYPGKVGLHLLLTLVQYAIVTVILQVGKIEHVILFEGAEDLSHSYKQLVLFPSLALLHCLTLSIIA